MKDLVPQGIKNSYHFFQAVLAVLINGYPSKKLKIIGVTGTDGKTTTVNLIYHILKSSGTKVSMISTVKAVVGEATFDTGFHVTTPSPFELQKFLKMMVKAGSKVAVLEVTSHGLDQNRVSLVDFYGAVITNVTSEHLDYHKDYDSYLRTKAKILSDVKYRILNGDDNSFKKLSETGSGKMVSFGMEKGVDISADDIKIKKDQLEFTVKFKNQEKNGGSLKVTAPLVGKFNVYNILAAIASVKSLGIENKEIEKALSEFPGVEGRMERIIEGQNFEVVVDFAHTPNAFTNTLKLLRDQTKGRLLCVFGSAGERDISKRSVMGEIAAKFCDYIILTGEDPRNEDVNKISEEIASGIKKEGGIQNETYWLVPDRDSAIEWAIKNLAKESDTVAVLGKGHEKSINIGGKEFPWSDQMSARSALSGRLRK